MLHLKFKFVIGVFCTLCLYSCTADQPSPPNEVGNTTMENDSIQLSLEQKIEDSAMVGISPQEILAEVHFSNEDQEYFDTFSCGYAQALALATQHLGKALDQELFLSGFYKGIDPNTDGLEILDASLTLELRRGVDAGYPIPEGLKKYENGKTHSYNFGIDAANKLQQMNFPLERIHMPSFQKALCAEVTEEEAEQNLTKMTTLLDSLSHFTLSSREKMHQNYLTKNAQRPEVTETQTRVQYEILKTGTGKQPTFETVNTVHFEGRTVDGRMFDSSIKRGEPVVFELDDMIEGWKEILPLMKEGGKWRISIPPTSGYGKIPYGTVPPYSVLIYDIELLKVE